MSSGIPSTSPAGSPSTSAISSVRESTTGFMSLKNSRNSSGVNCWNSYLLAKPSFQSTRSVSTSSTQRPLSTPRTVHSGDSSARLVKSR